MFDVFNQLFGLVKFGGETGGFYPPGKRFAKFYIA